MLSNPLSILNMGNSGGKKSQLSPIIFTNKSVDLKEAENNENKSESLKFNTSNYPDIYSDIKTGSGIGSVGQITSPMGSVGTTSFDKKFGFPQMENSEKKEEKEKLSNSTDNNKKYSYSFKESDNEKDKEFDDQFNEVILEDIVNDNKNTEKLGFNNLDEFEDSKKSMTQSNSMALSSYGHDQSVTNYKLDEFDHIEQVEAPMK
jgi:hypothetical protein